MSEVRKRPAPIARRKLPPPAPTDYLVVWYDGVEQHATRVVLTAAHDCIEAETGAIVEQITRLNKEPGYVTINAIIRITQASCRVILIGDDEERMV